jgi:hypothetical protein
LEVVVKIQVIDPPRVFMVGNAEKFPMRDCARVQLDPDEQVTFVTEAGAEYDLARKDWGFYATPSLNGRLASFGLHPVLVKNPSGRFFLLLVERGKEVLFDAYIASEGLDLVAWLDTSERLTELEGALRGR